MPLGECFLDEHGPHFCMISEKHGLISFFDKGNMIVYLHFLSSHVGKYMNIIKIGVGLIGCDKFPEDKRVFGYLLKYNEIMLECEVVLDYSKGIALIEQHHIMMVDDLSSSFPLNIISGQLFSAPNLHIVDLHFLSS